MNCTAEVQVDRTCINITCEEAEGSESIVAVGIFINERNEGFGNNIIIEGTEPINLLLFCFLFSQETLPHCISLSLLSDGENEIVLQLHGSEGTQRNATFRLS